MARGTNVLPDEKTVGGTTGFKLLFGPFLGSKAESSIGQ